MKIHYRDFIIEGETKELIEFSLACLMGNQNTIVKQTDDVYVITPQKRLNEVPAKKQPNKQNYGIPTKFLDTKTPTPTTLGVKEAFLQAIKPAINIDVSSKQGLRTRVIDQLMPQKRIIVKEIMKNAGTKDIENVRRTIKFLRKAGCTVRVEHYYTQYGKEYFDSNLGLNAIVTLMTLGSPEQAKEARKQEREAWKKYYTSTIKNKVESKVKRVVEAQKVINSTK